MTRPTKEEVDRICKELVDKGLLLEAGWNGLRLVALPEDASKVVNLDALIPREDMAEASDPAGSKLDKIDIHHLDDHFFVGALRKPDFQRETVHWSPEKVADLIRAFIDGDLIPAVILWQRGKNVFVIDGAHRLGALIAWVQDDYGDQRRSLAYFGGQIPEEQRKIAERVRKTVNGSIGPYAEYATARKNPQNVRPELQARLSNLAVNSIVAQWVPGVDEKAAEDSFFKINQAATPIDPTERRILKSRGAPNAVAARAIVRGGTGHRYWAKYGSDIKSQIESVAKEIYLALYQPPMGDPPVKTIDLPLAGRGYNALPFVFDLVNWANAIPDPTKAKEIDKPLEPDADGTQTIRYLKVVKNAVDLLTGDGSQSLGIHPVVYCYTRGGEFQPGALLATAELVKGLSAKDRLREFTKVRRKFEDFLLAHKDFITLTIKRTGAGRRSLNRIVRYLEFVIAELMQGKDDAQIVAALEADTAEFAYLVAARVPATREGANPNRRFNRTTKSASFLQAATQSPVRCAICEAMVHKNSIQIDHAQRRRQGGAADMSNAQVAHPYCNSIKN